jgi:hypothetical protein
MGLFGRRGRFLKNAETTFEPSETAMAFQDALQRCGPSYHPATLVLTNRAIYVAMESSVYAFPSLAINAMSVAADPADARHQCISFSHEGAQTGLTARVCQYGEIREVEWGMVSGNASLVGSEYAFSKRDHQFVTALRDLVTTNGGAEKPRECAFATAFITPQERGALAAFTQSQIVNAKVRLEADVAIAGMQIIKGRGGVLVGDEGIGWAINKLVSWSGTISWGQVGVAARVDRSGIQHGVSLQVSGHDSITDLAIQTDTKADCDHLIAAIEEYVRKRDRRVAQAERREAAAGAPERGQRPLTLEEDVREAFRGIAEHDPALLERIHDGMTCDELNAHLQEREDVETVFATQNMTWDERDAYLQEREDREDLETLYATQKRLLLLSGEAVREERDGQ